jgi:hypothetical protein
MLKPFRGTILAVYGSLVLSACDSSTSPAPLTPAQLARHIDSMAVAATSSSGRYPLLVIAEYGPAYSVSPRSVAVTTRSGTNTWHGFVYRFRAPAGVVPADSSYAIVAYSDNSLTDILWAQAIFESNTQIGTSVLLVTNDTVFVTSATATATLSLASTGGDCVLVSGLTIYTSQPQQGRCLLATFNGSFAGTFSTSNVEFQTMSIRPQSFAGLSTQ